MFEWNWGGITWDTNLLRRPVKWTLWVVCAIPMAAALYLNGGFGRIVSDSALVLTSIALGIVAAFGWALLNSERFQEFALRPEVDFDESAGSLRLITWGFSFLSVVLLFYFLAKISS